jgi:hypothetical protein
LFEYLSDQISIGILANLFSVPKTCGLFEEQTLDGIGNGNKMSDPTFHQLMAVMLFNLSFSSIIADKITANPWILLNFLNGMLTDTLNPAKLIGKVAKMVQQIVTITKDANIFKQHQPDFVEICRISGIWNQTDFISVNLCQEIARQP